MTKKNISKDSLDKLINNYPELQKSIRTTLKIKPNTYGKIKIFHDGTSTMSSHINNLIFLFILSLKNNDISPNNFRFLNPLLKKDNDSNLAIKASVKAFHSLKENNDANNFYYSMIYGFNGEESFIKAIQKNVFDRKDLIAKTLVMSSFSKISIDLLSKIIGTDKSTTFDFIINVSYQTYEGKRIDDAKRHYKPYKSILEKMCKLNDLFTEVEKELKEILESTDDYDIDELFQAEMMIVNNYKEHDPIDVAIGNFRTAQMLLKSDACPAISYAVEECEKTLKKEASNENI